MKEFSDSLPASELEHLWLNVCMHLFKFNEEENETATFNFQLSSPFRFTCNEDVFIEHAQSNKLKNRKEN